jgi:hypothetical protein
MKPALERIADAMEKIAEYFTPDIQTNADRIRVMNDEELCEFLKHVEEGTIEYGKAPCSPCLKDAALDGRCPDCEGCLLLWLKSGANLQQGLGDGQEELYEAD